MRVRVSFCFHLRFVPFGFFFLLTSQTHRHKHTHAYLICIFTLLYPHSVCLSHLLPFTVYFHSTSWLTDPYHGRQFYVSFLIFLLTLVLLLLPAPLPNHLC